MGITKRASRQMEQVPQLNCNLRNVLGLMCNCSVGNFGAEPGGRWHRAEALLGPWCAENPLPRFPRLGRLPIRLQIHPEWQARKWSPPVGALRLGRHTAA
jgi:hypothetical protein